MRRETYRLALPDSLGGHLCAANRYTDGSENSPDTFTLIFAHCSSAHKEQFEPTIEKLFDLKSSAFIIREAWALDCQSHGESSLLNEEKLRDGSAITLQDYGNLLHFFSQSQHVSGHRLIAVGHSASTSAWCLASTRFTGHLPFVAFVFIEPVMLPPPISPNDPRIRMGINNVKGVLSRKNRWDDMNDLEKWLGNRYPWKIWDRRVLEIYLKHGFKLINDEDGSQYVTSRITKKNEAKFYEHEEHFIAGAEVHKTCALVPVHCVFGERPEMV
ncbi:uncharacterized protein STEHIDRAFT_66011 [Stereum hirsutum FP-91666 SS1]|uniref:uncharacterized protein n=1 Tax=Stereum hirsutum (strain FP-91666) TaxID=721885 RepID=UPI000444A00E|nr:uncharacterized protein STEHIDRAFT_66011 [Stereum hirsutum FP-91666 SS1]EIM81900.1 hypothetical protein STEHIDRAFT_66011 [Stereum hirsutum FP-91666 SS1]